MDAPAQALWNKADTSVDTTPSLPVKRREIIRSRLSLVHRGGGRERGRIIQKLIISRIGFSVSSQCFSRARLHISVADGGDL